MLLLACNFLVMPQRLPPRRQPLVGLWAKTGRLSTQLRWGLRDAFTTGWALDTVFAGLVLSGLVWSCLVWCGLFWSGLVWCGVVWCGLVWCGVVCFSSSLCGALGPTDQYSSLDARGCLTGPSNAFNEHGAGKPWKTQSISRISSKNCPLKVDQTCDVRRSRLCRVRARAERENSPGNLRIFFLKKKNLSEVSQTLRVKW